jgi:hypothetical protein
VGHADRLHRAGGGLRRDGIVAGKGDVRGGVGVDLVGLAAHPAHLSCRADHLDRLNVLDAQVAGQARSVRVGALNADPQERSLAGDEPSQGAVTGISRRKLRCAEVLSRGADHRCIVCVCVRVHPGNNTVIAHLVYIPSSVGHNWEVPARQGRQDVDETGQG